MRRFAPSGQWVECLGGSALHHREARRPAARISHRRRAARFSTVWTYSQGGLHAGAGLLAAWLLHAVVQVVAVYSVPGDRVLLLAPVVGVGATSVGSARRVGVYRGLEEAAWQVARLGRSVRTAPAGRWDRSESGPGLGESGARPRMGRDLTLTDSARVGPGELGLFDLVIAAVEPRAVMSVRPTSWAPALTSRGVLAVITHCGRRRSWLDDPAGRLVRAGREDGLRYLDHVALLRVPVESGLGDSRVPVVAERVHSDLHVFGRQAGRSSGDAG
jgi:hypothetical protein